MDKRRPGAAAQVHAGWSRRGSAAALVPINFPHSLALQGIWTWQEIEAALAVGCKLTRVIDVYLHVGPEDKRFPFTRWWANVQIGRGMKGFAGLLAKATGNAL